MPQPLSGVKKRLAINKAVTWGVAVACAALDEIPFLSGKATRGAPVVVDETRGSAFSKDGTAGEITCTGSYTAQLRYIGLDAVLALFMGIAGAPVQQGATTAYKGVYKWNPDPYGLFATIAEHWGNYIAEVPSAKLAGITISGEVGPKPLTITFEIIGNIVDPASTTNTLATYASVTLPTGADRNAVMFAQTVFRMNDQGGAALGAGDVINPSKFSISLKRKLKGEYTGKYRTTGANPQDMVDEPTNDGMPELKLTLEFPTHTAATYLQALGADTRKKMDIVATGAVISGAYSYQHQWQFPHLQLVTADPTDDNGRIKEPLEFLIHGAAAAPTGMAGITDPLWWTVINTLSTDPLA